MVDMTLAISVKHHTILEEHLFPGDNLEAAAILVCGRAGATNERLCVHSVIPVPHTMCATRTPNRLTWPGEFLEQAIDSADNIDGSILLMHSHPGGTFAFSTIDDDSDAVTIPVLRSGSRNETIDHGSAIMIPNGSIKARLYKRDGTIQVVERVSVIGPDLVDISIANKTSPLPFSSHASSVMKGISACVVGASGTGSIVIENLARRGIGKLVLIDFDQMERKNLNRILNSTVSDAGQNSYKTQMLKQALAKFRPDLEVVTVEASIDTEAAIIAASGCDVIFSCVDTMEARHVCELMSQAFITPLIDMGVMIPTRKTTEEGTKISDVCGRVDYMFPGGTNLTGRGVVTPSGLYEEYLRRVDPAAYESRVDEGYMRGVIEEAPAVITLNMTAASLAVEEWMARLFPYRHDPNTSFDRLFFSLAAREFNYESSPEAAALSVYELLGRGLTYPLLGYIGEPKLEGEAA